jgi:hypothetical protein
MNRVLLSGHIGQYDVKITWTDTGKPQTSFALVCSEHGKNGASYKTSIPVLNAEPQAERLAETLELGIRCCWKANSPIRPAKQRISEGCWSRASTSRCAQAPPLRLYPSRSNC